VGHPVEGRREASHIHTRHLVVVHIQVAFHIRAVARIQKAAGRTLEVDHNPSAVLRMGRVEVHSPVHPVVAHNHVVEEVRSLAQAAVGRSLNHSEEAGLPVDDQDPDREGADHNTYLD